MLSSLAHSKLPCIFCIQLPQAQDVLGTYWKPFHVLTFAEWSVEFQLEFSSIYFIILLTVGELGGYETSWQLASSLHVWTVENLLWTLDSLEDLWHYLKKMPLCCSFVNAWLARPGTRTMPVIFLFIISHHDSSHPAVIGHCWFKYWYQMLCWWTSNSDMKRQMCLCSICLLLQLQQLGFSCLTKPLLLHQLRETVLCQCNIGVVN